MEVQLTHQSSPEAVVAWLRSTLKGGADAVLSKWTALGQAPDGFELLECSEQVLALGGSMHASDWSARPVAHGRVS